MNETATIPSAPAPCAPFRPMVYQVTGTNGLSVTVWGQVFDKYHEKVFDVRDLPGATVGVNTLVPVLQFGDDNFTTALSYDINLQDVRTLKKREPSRGVGMARIYKKGQQTVSFERGLVTGSGSGFFQHFVAENHQNEQETGEDQHRIKFFS